MATRLTGKTVAHLPRSKIPVRSSVIYRSITARMQSRPEQVQNRRSGRSNAAM